MKTIMVLDQKDYTPDMPVRHRECVRALICRDGLWAMQCSAAGDYKIPGGGVEENEQPLETLRREIREETGLLLLPETVREIGEILERRRDIFDPTVVYEVVTRFFFCGVSDETVDPEMTESELRQGLHPVWEPLDTIIAGNLCRQQEYWKARDTRFLQWLREQALQN